MQSYAGGGLTGRTRSEFRGNDFRQARLTDVMFVYGINLDLQLLPEDDRYIRVDDLPTRVRYARSIVSTWRTDVEREQALFLLRLYSEGGYREQQSLFTNRDKAPLDQTTTDRVWALLTASPEDDGRPAGPSDIHRR